MAVRSALRSMLVAASVFQAVDALKASKFLEPNPANGTLAFSNVAAQAKGTSPCTCEANNQQWVSAKREVPKCIFIDLGAADGNSFNAFLSNKYGPVANCPSGKWEAFLVEANPRFNSPLEQVSARFPGDVHLMSTTAAYDCEGKTSFYLDTTNTQHNFWGSSLSTEHPDVQKSGMEHVDVTLMNLNRLLKENTIPGDWVMVKMDIEGAEWDILPCLAEADSASLIDRLYVEVHPQKLSMRGTTDAALKEAEDKLKQRGVDIPPYFSDTF
eukprot:CAMPEP_0206450874 /NCGR_PEP_ID=MMETSP0324_2-20121206/18996_1 /ASSEMBLY_ACC=CAM_ASM_000836 /TAXON_ID=2866 /ORGANISM="Crypthecodinium cohnii, Strain Seligo" /LENGTH=269 /DNA_ID=CAMNT_0053920629 /DNA_START=49 /DNA_END=858 /DNA_ORIENTATION=+